MFFTNKEGVHGTQQIGTAKIMQVEKLEAFKEFKLEAVAGLKYIDGRWIDLIKWKDWKK